MSVVMAEAWELAPCDFVHLEKMSDLFNKKMVANDVADGHLLFIRNCVAVSSFSADENCFVGLGNENVIGRSWTIGIR